MRQGHLARSSALAAADQRRQQGRVMGVANGRWRMSLPPLSRPATEWIMLTSSASAGSSGGKRHGRCIVIEEGGK